MIEKFLFDEFGIVDVPSGPSEIEIANYHQLEWNRHEIESLARNGYDFSIPAELTHSIEFLRRKDKESFVKAVEKLHFEVYGTPYKCLDSCLPFKLKIFRCDLIDIESLNALTLKLSNLADSFRGEYITWILLDPPASYLEEFYSEKHI